MPPGLAKVLKELGTACHERAYDEVASNIMGFPELIKRMRLSTPWVVDVSDSSLEEMRDWLASLPFEAERVVTVLWPYDHVAVDVPYHLFLARFDDLWSPSSDDALVLGYKGAQREALLLHHDETFIMLSLSSEAPEEFCREILAARILTRAGVTIYQARGEMVASMDDDQLSGRDLLRRRLKADRDRSSRNVQALANPGGFVWALMEDDIRDQEPGPARMGTSLGLVGDLLWMLVPETRTHIYAEFAREFEAAMENDREIYSLSSFDFLYQCFWIPVLFPALEAPSDPEIVRRCCVALRAMLASDSEEGGSVREAVDRCVAENIIDTDLEAPLTAVDSGLVGMLRDLVHADPELDPVARTPTV